MESILSWFSVNKIFFTVLDYPMSYLEFIGTILYLWSVWLIAQRKILTWPIGIVSVILYATLFYQIRLYSDTIEQLYYLGACVYGWWFWKRDQANAPSSEIEVRLSNPGVIGAWIAVTLVTTILVTFFMMNIHTLLPTIFPAPASFPFLDALTTVMSFTAMFLMAQKRIESWVYWIIVDVIGIGLYYTKGVKFVALLYVILLIIALNGLFSWLKTRQVPDEHPNDK